jgi:hypothetical protein
MAELFGKKIRHLPQGGSMRMFDLLAAGRLRLVRASFIGSGRCLQQKYAVRYHPFALGLWFFDTPTAGLCSCSTSRPLACRCWRLSRRLALLPPQRQRHVT